MKYIIVIDYGQCHPAYHKIDKSLLPQDMVKLIDKYLDQNKLYEIHYNNICQVLGEVDVDSRFMESSIKKLYFCKSIINDEIGFINNNGVLIYGENNNKKRFFDKVFNR